MAGDQAAAIPLLATTALNANTLDVPIALLIVVAGLVAASVIAVFVLWRKRRGIQIDPALAGIPLVVNDVVKTYGDGFRAVDVSFRAEGWPGRRAAGT